MKTHQTLVAVLCVGLLASTCHRGAKSPDDPVAQALHAFEQLGSEPVSAAGAYLARDSAAALTMHVLMLAEALVFSFDDLPEPLLNLERHASDVEEEARRSEDPEAVRRFFDRVRRAMDDLEARDTLHALTRKMDALLARHGLDAPGVTVEDARRLVHENAFALLPEAVALLESIWQQLLDEPAGEWSRLLTEIFPELNRSVAKAELVSSDPKLVRLILSPEEFDDDPGLGLFDVRDLETPPPPLGQLEAIFEEGAWRIRLGEADGLRDRLDLRLNETRALLSFNLLTDGAEYLEEEGIEITDAYLTRLIVLDGWRRALFEEIGRRLQVEQRRLLLEMETGDEVSDEEMDAYLKRQQLMDEKLMDE